MEITSFLILLDEYKRSYLTINVRCRLQNMGNGCKNTKWFHQRTHFSIQNMMILYTLLLIRIYVWSIFVTFWKQMQFFEDLYVMHRVLFILSLNFLQNDRFFWRLFFLAWINKWNMYKNVAKHFYKNKRLPDSLMLKGSLRFNLYGLCSCKTRSRSLTFRGHV